MEPADGVSVTVVSEGDTERIISYRVTAFHLYLGVAQPKAVSMASLPCFVSCGMCLPAELEGGRRRVRHDGGCGNDGDGADKVSLGLRLVSFASEICVYACA